jgi:general stress protein YciG
MERRNQTSGFASMDRRKQREIARKGGMAAHRKGVAHEFTTEEARNAGRKGGQNVSVNRSHMIEIGRLGGQRSAERRRNRMGQGLSMARSESVPREHGPSRAVGIEELLSESDVEIMSQQNVRDNSGSAQPGGWEADAN